MGRYNVALGDFHFATSVKTYRATAKVLIHTARCRLFLGSLSSALLALREALSLEPGNMDALALKKRVIELQGYAGNYEGARSRKHWKMARQSYEAYLKACSQEGCAVPTEVQCWGVELLIVRSDFAEAVVATE